ncbi:MAG TPA: hypothetical protein VEB21_04585, partial [Terriglobales bacterium]|nr:hypothetical protein [Terriglobales bacterium]
MNTEQVQLQRDCQAVAIPAGHNVTLTKGTEAYITQSLGGSYTLQVPSHGGLFRISGADGDAIGKQKLELPETVDVGDGDLESLVWTVLRGC